MAVFHGVAVSGWIVGTPAFPVASGEMPIGYCLVFLPAPIATLKPEGFKLAGEQHVSGMGYHHAINWQAKKRENLWRVVHVTIFIHVAGFYQLVVFMIDIGTVESPAGVFVYQEYNRHEVAAVFIYLLV